MTTPRPISRRRMLTAAVAGTLAGDALLRWLARCESRAEADVDANLDAEIINLYALRDGQDVKALRPPFPRARLEFYQASDPSQAQSIPEGPTAMYFRWADGRPKRWGSTFGGGGSDFRTLMRMLLDLSPETIEGDEKLIRTELPGDFVVRVGATPERVAAQVGEILREQYRLPARVEFREAERKVLVARGRYQFKALPNRPENRIDIYGKTLTDPLRGGGGSGDLADCLQWLGTFVHRRIVSEVPGADQVQVGWHLNERLTSDRERAEDHEEAATLRHFTEQTGVAFAEETRRVKVLFLEREK